MLAPVSVRQHLRRVGNGFLVGGLGIVALSLAVMVYDEMATRGTDAVVATCVLFLWVGGIGAGIGLLLRIVARARRSQLSPFSPGWRPPPVTRSRPRR
jgi:uncharacterized membrane protein YidH (DUF202 family)